MHIEYIFKPSCLEKGAGGYQPTRHRDYNDGHQEKDGLSSAWPLPGYDQTGKDWHFEKTLDPTWDDIIASIDRLDKFRYPWLWLFIGDETEHATVDCLTIMGGDGVYWLGLSAGKYEQLRLSDPQKGTHEIELWTSDQGLRMRKVCDSRSGTCTEDCAVLWRNRGAVAGSGMGITMNLTIVPRLRLPFIITLCCCAAAAQTRSDCRPAPPMPPNVKPGVGGMTLAPDGKTLLVAGGDGKIRFVDLNSGEVKRIFTGHKNAVYIANFSPDRKLLASSSRDNTAIIWDVTNGKELRKFAGFRCSVKAVAFSPDGRTLAASGNDGMLKLWDVNSGKELKSLVHRDSPDIDMSTYAFEFSRDGKQIYAGNGDGTISVWDVASGKEVRNWKAHDTYVFKLAPSSDHRRLVSFGDMVVKVWDTTTWRELQTLSMPKTPGANTFSTMVAISHNGKLIAASGAQFDPKQNTYLSVDTIVWNAKTGERLFTMSGHKFDVNGLVFTRDDRFLLTGSVDRTIKFWDMRTGKETRTITLN